MDIQQVAKRAGVSTATVSRVLNGSPKVREETAQRVRRVIDELNYVPNTSARNLRIGRSELYGLIVSDIKNPFFPDLIDHFEALAASRGIDVVFTHTNYDSRRLATCIRRLVERNVDGIAVMTSEVDEQALKIATQRKIPVVLLNHPSLKDIYSTVLVDYTRGYREAVEHLKKLGHRNLVFLTGPSELSSVRRRQKAFETAAKKCGISVPEKQFLLGDMRVEGGRTAMETLLERKPRPTAVVAANDLMAIGAMQAALAAGLRVPEDISIVGFDDLPIATIMHPQLTTIHLSRHEIAGEAFEQLTHLHQKQTSQAHRADRRVHPRLIVRESTGPAPSVLRARIKKLLG
ncbi:MAG: LacI family DNA-binding transcriptional regulator [Acidobacteriaceae bacterium]